MKKSRTGITFLFSTFSYSKTNILFWTNQKFITYKNIPVHMKQFLNVSLVCTLVLGNCLCSFTKFIVYNIMSLTLCQ